MRAVPQLDNPSNRQRGRTQSATQQEALLQDISGDVVSTADHSRDPAQPLGGAAPGYHQPRG